MASANTFSVTATQIEQQATLVNGTTVFRDALSVKVTAVDGADANGAASATNLQTDFTQFSISLFKDGDDEDTLGNRLVLPSTLTNTTEYVVTLIVEQGNLIANAIYTVTVDGYVSSTNEVPTGVVTQQDDITISSPPERLADGGTLSMTTSSGDDTLTIKIANNEVLTAAQVQSKAGSGHTVTTNDLIAVNGGNSLRLDGADQDGAEYSSEISVIGGILLEVFEQDLSDKSKVNRTLKNYAVNMSDRGTTAHGTYVDSRNLGDELTYSYTNTINISSTNNAVQIARDKEEYTITLATDAHGLTDVDGNALTIANGQHYFVKATILVGNTSLVLESMFATVTGGETVTLGGQEITYPTIQAYEVASQFITKAPNLVNIKVDQASRVDGVPALDIVVDDKDAIEGSELTSFELTIQNTTGSVGSEVTKTAVILYSGTVLRNIRSLKDTGTNLVKDGLLYTFKVTGIDTDNTTPTTETNGKLVPTGDTVVLNTAASSAHDWFVNGAKLEFAIKLTNIADTSLAQNTPGTDVIYNNTLERDTVSVSGFLGGATNTRGFAYLVNEHPKTDSDFGYASTLEFLPQVTESGGDTNVKLVALNSAQTRSAAVSTVWKDQAKIPSTSVQLDLYVESIAAGGIASLAQAITDSNASAKTAARNLMKAYSGTFTLAQLAAVKTAFDNAHIVNGSATDTLTTPYVNNKANLDVQFLTCAEADINGKRLKVSTSVTVDGVTTTTTLTQEDGTLYSATIATGNAAGLKDALKSLTRVKVDNGDGPPVTTDSGLELAAATYGNGTLVVNGEGVNVFYETGNYLIILNGVETAPALIELVESDGTTSTGITATNDECEEFTFDIRGNRNDFNLFEVTGKGGTELNIINGPIATGNVNELQFGQFDEDDRTRVTDTDGNDIPFTLDSGDIISAQLYFTNTYGADPGPFGSVRYSNMRDQIATINTKPASLVASIANQTLAERTNQEVKVTLLDDAPKLTNDASATLLTLLRLSVDIKITPQTGNPVTYTMIFTSTDGTMVDARAGEAGYTTSLTQTMDAGTKKNTFVITVKDGESVPGASAVASDGAVTANTGTFTVPAGAKVEILSASLKNTNGEGEGLAVIPASVRIEKNSTINTDAITATLLTNALSKVDVFEITGAGTAANDAAQNVKFRMADIGKTLIEMVTNNGAQSEVKIALAGKADGSNSLELSEANVLTRAIETFVLQQRAEYTGSQTFNDQYTTGIAFDATQTIALTDQEVTDLVTAGRNLQLVLFVKDTFKNGETNTEILASTAVTLEHQVAEITTLSLVSPGELTSDSDFTLNGTATINYIDAAAPQPGFAVPTTLTTTLYVVPDERPTAEMNSSVYQETTLANKIAAAKSAGKDPLATRGVNLNDLGTGYKVATVVESLVDAGVYDIKTSENVLTNSIPFNFPTVPAKYFGKQLFAKSILTSTVSKGQTSDSSSTARTIERGDSRFTDTYLDEFTIGNGTGRYSNAALVKDLIAKESSLALGVGPTSQNARSEVSLPTNYTSLTNYGALNNTGPVGTIYTPNGFVVESALVVKSTTDAENIAFEALGSGELKAYNNRAANTIFKGTGIRDTVVFTGVNGATVPVQLNGKTAVNVVLGTTKWSDLLSPDNTGGSFKAAGQYYVADFEKNSANSLQWGTNFFGYKLSTTVYDNNNAALQSNGSDVTVVNGVDISGPTTSDKMKAFTSSFVETSIAGVTGAHWANTLGAALETAIVAGDVLQAAVGDTLTISNTEANAEKLALYIEAATPSPEPTEGIFAHGLVGNDNVLGNSQDPTGVLYLFSTPSSAETATTYLTIANDASNPTNYGLGTNATVTKTNATVTAKALANDGGDVIISS